MRSADLQAHAKPLLRGVSHEIAAFISFAAWMALLAAAPGSIKMEREFNRRAGFTKEDDRIPKWMTEQPLPPHNAVFDVSEEVLDHFFDGIE